MPACACVSMLVCACVQVCLCAGHATGRPIGRNWWPTNNRSEPRSSAGVISLESQIESLNAAGVCAKESKFSHVDTLVENYKMKGRHSAESLHS